MEKTEIPYVKQAYTVIAKQFHDTRPTPWYWITQFYKEVNEKIPYAVILDHGCGGGRNMTNIYLDDDKTCKTEFEFMGVDNCHEFVNIAQKNGNNVLYGDLCDLPYEDAIFDAVISVASFHHLSSVERRINALNEMNRVMRSGAMGCMSVWSIKQPKNSKNYGKFVYGDNMVPWKNKQGEILVDRYYYIFNHNELEGLLLQAGFIITEWKWEHGNEIVKFLKY